MGKNFQRWVSLGYVGASFVVYVVVMELGVLVWDLLRWSYPDALPLTPPELIGMIGGAGLFALLRLNHTINGFMNEAAVELSKVSWPTRKESVASAGVIVTVVAFCAAALVLYDVVWTWSVKWFY